MIQGAISFRLRCSGKFNNSSFSIRPRLSQSRGIKNIDAIDPLLKTLPISPKPENASRLFATNLLLLKYPSINSVYLQENTNIPHIATNARKNINNMITRSTILLIAVSTRKKFAHPTHQHIHQTRLQPNHRPTPNNPTGQRAGPSRNKSEGHSTKNQTKKSQKTNITKNNTPPVIQGAISFRFRCGGKFNNSSFSIRPRLSLSRGIKNINAIDPFLRALPISPNPEKASRLFATNLLLLK
jgi:hypothetical protein